MASTRTIAGTLYDPEGTALSGTVTFEPTEPLYDTDGNLIAMGPVISTLSSGAFTLTVYATDDATTSPEGATYTVTESLTGTDGNPRKRKFRCEVPAGGSTLRYEDITEAVPSDSTWVSYATTASLTAERDAWERRVGGKASTMRAWQTALAGSDAATATVVVIGDSYSEQKAWTAPLHERILAAAPAGTAAAPVGSLRSLWNAPKQFITWTTDQGAANEVCGLGGQATELDVGEEGEQAYYCDAIEVYYTVQETGGADLEIRVDGVLQTTIDTTDAGVSTYESGRSWSSGALTWGAHTLNVTASGAGTAIVDGGMFHCGTLAKGVQIHNGGNSGYKAASFLPATHSGTWDHIAAVSPDLVIVMLGTNDYVDGLDTFTTNLDTVCGEVATQAPNASVLLVSQWAALDRGTAWEPFRDAISAEASSRSWEHLDLYDLFGDVGDTSDTYALSDDGTHPNAKGGEAIAAAVAERVVAEMPPRLPLLSDGSVRQSDTLTGWYLGGDSGMWKVGHSSGEPMVQLYDDVADTQPAFEVRGTRSDEPGVWMGPGGTTAPSKVLTWASSGVVDLNTHRLTDVVDPTGAQDAATKAYVDAAHDELWLPANQFGAVTGSPTLTGNTWYLDATSDEAVSTSTVLPADWSTYDVHVLWTHVGGTATNVARLTTISTTWTAGQAVLFYESDTGNVDGTAGASLTIIDTTTNSGVTAPSSGYLSLQITRDADHANDNLAVDAVILGARLVKAS